MNDPLQREEFAAEKLMKEYPPVWQHPAKRWVFDIACPAGAAHRGTLGYSRWSPQPLPPRMAWPVPYDLVSSRPDFYDYEPCAASAPAMEWHVNFADPHLFVAYGTSLLAQDEMQVAEHPSLGALKEALDARGVRAVTKDASGPTPILITGAERRCRIATDVNPAEGRPHGLYGNQFARASEETIRRAITRIDPPTITNFIAIAAPLGGAGYYTGVPIRYTLTAAYTGFRAAVEITRSADPAAETNIHTGFWGCGAFGGNRVLMTLLQILAASAAGVRRLVFHTGDTTGLRAIAEAQGHLHEIFMTPTIVPGELVQHLVDRQFPWGESDGN
jgi:hypothetical protein